MAIVKCKPTSAGRRFVVKVVNQELHKGAPYAPLLEKKSKSGGRNNNGRITTRHIGGGHKQHYRLVDFRRNKDGIPAIVERVEYDPNRTAHIALLKYADGERRYIIAPKGVAAGDQLISGIGAPIKSGGVAMNPVDHPHGGGEGRTSAGRHPVSPWGLQTKGKKTRSNKRTDNMIVRRRK